LTAFLLTDLKNLQKHLLHTAVHPCTVVAGLVAAKVAGQKEFSKIILHIIKLL